MNELIKIEERNGEQLVSARELHKFLEITERFQQWIDKKIEKYHFTENKDYIGCKFFNTLAKQELQDYLLKISMAKELAMLQNNDRGKEAREYFIKCEEAWNSEDMVLARALQIQNKKILDYKEKIEVLEEKIEKQKPKVVFADAVETSRTSILIGELAKLIKQNGYNIGQQRLFEWLRDNGYLIKRKGSDYNMPTQKSMELGLFEVKETAVNHSDGHIDVKKTPKVTGKGQIYFINKFKDKVA